MKTFDAIILGAGQAGPALAGRLTAAGMTVALVERQLFGGTCVNTGCTPTKALIASARVAHLCRRSAEHGVLLPTPPRIDFAQVQRRARQIAATARAGVEQRLRSMSGCTVIQGHARFEGPGTIRVGQERLSAPKIFLNVGGRAAIPGIPGVEHVPFLTHSSILELDELPEHLIVIGGSYVGLEFAQMYRRFGSEVTVVERAPRLIPREDPEISAAIEAFFESEGIRIRTAAECIRLTPLERGVAAELDCGHGAGRIEGSHVLMALGRRPNTEDLDLEKACVLTDERGYVCVDDELKTTARGIWALGDCNGHGAFTHTAYNDYEIVAANLLTDERRYVSDRVPAYALFTDPPLGRAGLTETEARATGRELRIASMPMSDVSRAIEKGETRGLMKILVDAESEKILGAAILGIGGDETIHAVLNLMSAGVPYSVLEHTMGIHPTVAEYLPTLLGSLKNVPANRRAA